MILTRKLRINNIYLYKSRSIHKMALTLSLSLFTGLCLINRHRERDANGNRQVMDQAKTAPKPPSSFAKATALDLRMFPTAWPMFQGLLHADEAEKPRIPQMAVLCSSFLILK